MKVNAFVQARMSSRRLPGKVLKPILNRPMLSFLIERLRKCELINNIIVVTSDEPSDQDIVNFCHQQNIAIFRGSLNNVLNRFTSALTNYPCDHIVRITADCPLIDPEVIDQVIQLHINGNYDYTNNCDTPSFPHGLDTEVIRADLLKSLEHHELKPSDREHVTLYVRNRREQFKLGILKNSSDLSDYRLTVDEIEDLTVITTILESLYISKPDFSYLDVVQFLEENKELKFLNAKYKRNEDLMFSLEQEKQS